MIEGDLANLEKNLEGQSVLKSGAGPPLASAAKRFLASEIHALIAEAPRKAPTPKASGGTAETKSAPIFSGSLFRNSLLLAPVWRLFSRVGWLLKIVLGWFVLYFGALELVMLLRGERLSAAFYYLGVAGVCYYFERRFQRDSDFETPEEPKAVTAQSDVAARAAKALQEPVANGMVTAAYIDRAGAAIGKAVPLLYGPLVLPMTLWITTGATALFFVAQFTFRATPMITKAGLLAVAAAAAWFVVERRTQTTLQSMLGPNLYGRLKGQFRRAKNRYRLFLLAGFLFAWFTTSWMVGLLR